jgi:hypothetical protein
MDGESGGGNDGLPKNEQWQLMIDGQTLNENHKKY